MTPPDRGGLTVSSLWETHLRQHEEERHARIIQSAQPIPAYPSYFTAESVLGLPSSTGFMRLADAAEAMSATVEETVEMVRRGLLEADEYGRVRPAVVSVLGVER